MNMYTITFMPDDRSIQVEAGTTLLEAQRRAGYAPEAPCGGNGKCGKCTVEVLEGAALGIQKACSIHIGHDMTVRLTTRTVKNQILEKGQGRTVDIHPWLPDALKDSEKQVCLAAVDLGTTTIAAYLLDAQDGHTLAVNSCLNPQSPYGADVINRCEYALGGGEDTLADCVRTSIDRLVQEMAQEASVAPEQIASLCIVGNSCMQHLFLHWPVNSLVAAPYLPHSKDPLIGLASDFGIHIHPQGRLWALPVIESFVGADTLACILATDLEKRDKCTLMIDIGTNGELVLSKDGKLLTCSTAAGPALEGAKISCGMRGGTGAIDHVTLDTHQKLSYSIIGDCEAAGICGSGLLDLTACLLGGAWGTVSTLVYLLVGFVGLPVFSNYMGGASRLLGPTGGYLVGYLPMIFIAGSVAELAFRRFKDQGRRGAVLTLAVQLLGMVLATAVLYAFGTAWYCFQAEVDLQTALNACVRPFIPFDLLKIAAALAVGTPVRRGLERAGLL